MPILREKEPYVGPSLNGLSGIEVVSDGETQKNVGRLKSQSKEQMNIFRESLYKEYEVAEQGVSIFEMVRWMLRITLKLERSVEQR